MLSLDSIVQRDPNVIAAEAEQDLVMVSIANGFYYGVSDVAREIWEAIERPERSQVWSRTLSQPTTSTDLHVQSKPCHS